jgi:pre-rRNA-processing protein TSR3
MSLFPSTIVIRHRKENLKKCSLSGLEGRKDFIFFRYPLEKPVSLSNYILLTLNAEEELAANDAGCGLLLLDATWRYAQAMEKALPMDGVVKKRLPHPLITAYPRKQNDCVDPNAGLASIEAIVGAYAVLGRPLQGLLDHYYWKDTFLKKNESFLLDFVHFLDSSGTRC